MKICYPYNEISCNDLPCNITLQDHLWGFDKNFYNDTLGRLDNLNKFFKITYHQILSDEIKNCYKNIEIKFSADLQDKLNLDGMLSYNGRSKVNFKNFICCFNGSNHVSRQLLSSILENQGHFDPHYSSKNFATSNDKITGHLNSLDLTEEEVELYDKFFKTTEKFNESVYSFGYNGSHHNSNIYNLESKLTQSFVNIVSETIATSYYPFVTEKFLYSIVTKGLFLAYAQPGWHQHLRKYYGFKLYNKIFDYTFDSIQNPVKRLVKLIEMISKFAKLSTTDWRDMYYILEKDTIEYNYNHYFSKDYLKHMKQFDNISDI